MKKYNEIIYNEITTKGQYKDNNYKYILLDNKYIFKSWDSSHITNLKYEFFGVLDKNKKDVYTENNIAEIQADFTKQAKKSIINEILKNKEQYKEQQKNNFNELLKNEDFKRSIDYYFFDNYSSNNFNELFVTGTTPEQLEEAQSERLIATKPIFSNDAFFEKYIEEKNTDILAEFIDYYKADANISKWDFDYNWNNKTNLNIEATFKNDISLKMNKIDYIVGNYKKLYNNPTKELLKAKKLYNLCKDFKEQNNNKTCKIVLNNNKELKVQDFDFLITILQGGQKKHCCYRLFTNAEICQLQDINEAKGRGTRESDLFIEDITKIEYNKKVIFEEV